MNPPAAWDVYAEQLSYLGLGYPLWTPDPERIELEMQLADVGFLREGEFIRITQTIFPGKAERQENTSPSSIPIVPFNPPQDTIRGPREKITNKLLFSHTMRDSSYSGEIEVLV